MICSLLVKNVPSTLVPQSNEKQELMRVDLVFPLVSKTLMFVSSKFQPAQS